MMTSPVAGADLLRRGRRLEWFTLDLVFWGWWAETVDGFVIVYCAVGEALHIFRGKDS